MYFFRRKTIQVHPGNSVRHGMRFERDGRRLRVPLGVVV